MKITPQIVKPVLVGVALFVLLPFPPAMAGGDESAALRLTLSEAVRTALRNNDELKAEMNARFAKQDDIGLSRSYLLPRVSLEERYLRTNSPAYAFMTKLGQERIGSADFVPESLNHPAAISDFQTALAFEQPLFLRKASIGLEMSKLEAAAADEALYRKKEEVAFGVLQAYLMVGTAGAYTEVTQKALEDALEHQRLAQARYEAGLGLYSDILRAATAVAEARQRQVSAAKNHAVAKRMLGLATGSAEMVDVAQRPPDLPLRSLEDYRQQALARKDLKAMELRRANSGNGIRLAEAGYFPSLGLGGSYQLNDHNTPLGGEGDGWQLSAFLRWELFDGTRRSHERSKAKHQSLEAEAQLEGMKKRVSFQVEEAWLRVDEARKNLELARESLKTAEEGSRLVRVRYEGALSPIVDLLGAQVSFDHARVNLVARENDYKLAVAQMSYASGTILRELQVEEP